MSGRDKTPASQHYGRAQFLNDVAWMGLDLEQAFSRANLRRQRDQLMHIHHPDRGGSEDMAARINITYSRMLVWLDSHLERRGNLHTRRERAFAQEVFRASQKPPASAKQIAESMRIYATVLGAAATIMSIGVSSFIRRRR